MLAQIVLPGSAPLLAATNKPSTRTERIELRDAKRKVYETPEGLEYELYVKPVHELAANGKWIERQAPSFRKVRGNSTFAVEGMPFRAELTGDDPLDPKLTVEQKGYRVAFGLGQAMGTKGSFARAVGNMLSFQQVDGATELQYISSPSGLKETLVLNRATEQNVFRFPLITEDVTFAPQDDNSVVATSPEGEVLWRIAPATAEDKNGSVPPSITQTVVREDDEQFLEVTVDHDWLVSPERVWPVLIDPTVIVEPDPADGMDTTIREDRADQSICYFTSRSSGEPISPYLKAGTVWPSSECSGRSGVTTYRSLIKFDLHTLPVGAEILDARLELYKTSPEASSIDLRLIERDWLESTATWTTPWQTAGGDLGPVFKTVSLDAGSRWVSMSITDQVRAWTEGRLPNRGIAFVGPTLSAASFYSSDATDPTKVPHLIVRFAPNRIAPSVVVDMETRRLAVSDSRYNVLSRLEVSIDSVPLGDLRNLRLPPQVQNPTTGAWESQPLSLPLPALAGVAPGEHILRVRAWNPAGNVGTVDVPVYLAAPPPTNLSAVSLGSNRVQLTWYPAMESSGSYRLYRGIAPTFDSATLVSSQVMGGLALDTPPQSGTFYYWVTSVSPAGVEGEPSDSVQVAVGPQPGLQVGFAGTALSTLAHPVVFEAETATGTKPAPFDRVWLARADGYESLTAVDGQMLTLRPTGPNELPVHLVEFPVLASINAWRGNQGLAPLSSSELAVLLRQLSVSWTGVAKAPGTPGGATVLAWNSITSVYDTVVTATGNPPSTHTLTGTVPLTQLDNLGRLYLLIQGQAATTSSDLAATLFATDAVSLTIGLANEPPTILTATPAGNGTVQIFWPTTSLGVDIYRSSEATFNQQTATAVQLQSVSGSYVDQDRTLMEQGVPFYYHAVAQDHPE